MTSISFDARRARLSVAGECDAVDQELIVEAIEAFVRLVAGRSLQLDLTRSTSIPLEVATAVMTVCRDLKANGVQVDVRAIEESPVARRLDVARADIGRPQASE